MRNPNPLAATKTLPLAMKCTAPGLKGSFSQSMAEKRSCLIRKLSERRTYQIYHRASPWESLAEIGQPSTRAEIYQHEYSSYFRGSWIPIVGFAAVLPRNDNPWPFPTPSMVWVGRVLILAVGVENLPNGNQQLCLQNWLIYILTS